MGSNCKRKGELAHLKHRVEALEAEIRNIKKAKTSDANTFEPVDARTFSVNLNEDDSRHVHLYELPTVPGAVVNIPLIPML